MINPFIKLTGVDNEYFYVDVTKIQCYFSCSSDKPENGRTVIFDTLGGDIEMIVQDTPDQITALIQKYHDDCLLATVTSAALSRADSRVTDAVVMAKRVISRLKESVSEGEENAP